MKSKSAQSRSNLILATYKFCRKEYPAIAPPKNRNVLEHMLYACCLENSTPDAADEAFAKLQENFFDWNEVRVTTVPELAEVMKRLTFPRQAAKNLKKTLHGIFEAFYQFDLDFLRKENLSKSIAQFEKFKGVSPFVISYVVQHGLGGHSIPLDRAMMFLFYTLGIVSAEEGASGHVVGLERTVAKSQGLDFASCVHQFAVTYLKTPFNPRIREQILALSPDAKERFPKRGKKKLEDGSDDSDLEESADDPVDEVAHVESAPKKRGRKKKVLPTSEATSPSAKKKVGRPKKPSGDDVDKSKTQKLPPKTAKKTTKKRPKPR